MFTVKLNCLYELTNPIDAMSLLKTKSRNKNKINVCFDGLTFEINYIFKVEKKGGS